MNKLKILNTVALLVIVATPISQASVFDDINENAQSIYNSAVIIAAQRDEALDQRDKLRVLLEKNKKETDEFVEMLSTCYDLRDELKKRLRQ